MWHFLIRKGYTCFQIGGYEKAEVGFHPASNKPPKRYFKNYTHNDTNSLRTLI